MIKNPLNVFPTIVDESDVNISIDSSSDIEKCEPKESVDSDVEEKFLPQILIADDDMVQLRSLKDQVKYVTGPDGNNQPCDMAIDGDNLIKYY